MFNLKYLISKNFEKLSKWAAFIALFISLFNGGYTLLKVLMPKTHDVTLYLADVNFKDTTLEVVVGYFNGGDFPELISSASASILFKEPIPNEYDAVEIGWGVGDCFSPFVIEPGKVEFKKYLIADIYSDVNIKEKFEEGSGLDLVLYLSILSPDNGRNTARLKVGSLVKTNFETQNSSDATNNSVDSKGDLYAFRFDYEEEKVEFAIDDKAYSLFPVEELNEQQSRPDPDTYVQKTICSTDID